MAKKPETQFRTRVREFLVTLKNTKITPVQQLAIRGDPDFILLMLSVYVDLELKDDNEEPTALQKWKHSETIRCGGRVIVAEPRTWERTKHLLRKLDAGENND